METHIITIKSRIEKLKSKRNTVQVWLSKDGLISIDDRLMAADDISTVMYDKRLANPQIVVSLKGDEVISSSTFGNLVLSIVA